MGAGSYVLMESGISVEGERAQTFNVFEYLGEGLLNGINKIMTCVSVLERVLI